MNLRLYLAGVLAHRRHVRRRHRLRLALQPLQRLRVVVLVVAQRVAQRVEQLEQLLLQVSLPQLAFLPEQLVLPQQFQFFALQAVLLQLAVPLVLLPVQVFLLFFLLPHIVLVGGK